MKVAVMGYGTVGSGVVEVIETHEKALRTAQQAKCLR